MGFNLRNRSYLKEKARLHSGRRLRFLLKLSA